MHMSRQLEETKRTKFRGGREEEFRKNSGGKNKPHKVRHREEKPKDKFDLWEDTTEDGC